MHFVGKICGRDLANRQVLLASLAFSVMAGLIVQPASAQRSQGFPRAGSVQQAGGVRHAVPEPTLADGAEVEYVQPVVLKQVAGTPAAVPTGPVAPDMRARFVRRKLKDKDGEHRYVVYLPVGYTPNRAWPTLLYLHGASKRGSDGIKHATDGLARVLKTWKSPEHFPFIVIFPQCEDTRGRILTGWAANRPDGKRALEILDDAAKTYRVNPKRVILTGWSMGAYGTWSLADAHPERFAGVVSLSGGGNPQNISGLMKLPIWAIHGAEDKIVLPSESEAMVRSVEKAGGLVRFSLVVETGHDITRAVYSNPQVIAWMLAPKRDSEERNLAKVKLDPKTKVDPSGIPEEDQDPFVPALEVSRALTIRLGNKALKAAAENAPHAVAADAIQGQVPDKFSTNEVQGRQFDIQLSGITYRGTVERAHFKAYKKDRLNLQIGMRNLIMTIGASYVNGRGRSAVAGPIHVVMGHRRPLWLNMDVKPTVKDRKIRFEIVASEFVIPDDNWYVTYPQGVEAHGLFMTEQKVANSLVTGLYGRKSEFEQQIHSFIPQMVQRIETQLEVASASKVVEALWPLPVYRPQVRVFPEYISVDPHGLSVVMGIIVGASEPDKPPAKVRKVQMSPEMPKIPESEELVLGVATNLIQHMTEEIITSEVAQIHVLDIPRGTFSEFSDRKVLESIFPHLKSLPANVEVNSELVLVEPLTLKSEGSTGITGAASVGRKDPLDPAGTEKKPGEKQSNGQPAPVAKSYTYLQMAAPKLRIRVTTSDDPGKNIWKPYANIDYSLVQRAQLELGRPSFTRRSIRFALPEEPRIDVQIHADAAIRKDAKVDVAKKLFAAGWKKWTGKGIADIVTVADLNMGYTKLRLDQINHQDEYLNISFETSGIRINNLSKEPLVYEIHAPYAANWSEPITLAPGQNHVFEIATPLRYRRLVDGQYKTYTLPAGSDNRFRSPRAGGKPQLFLVTE